MPEEYEIVPEKGKNVSSIRPYKGIILSLIAVFLFCSGNLIIKKVDNLSGTVHLTVYNLICVLFFPSVACFKKENPFGDKENRRLLLLKGIMISIALVLFYNGVILLPPSDLAALCNMGLIIVAISSRILFKEKLNFPVFIAIVLTILGVTLISKPSFLFPLTEQKLNASSLNHSFEIELNKKISDDSAFKLGIFYVSLSQFFFAMVGLLTKYLANRNVNWASSNLYNGYIGLPTSALLSFILYYYGGTKINLEDAMLLLSSVVYSALSGMCKIAAVSACTLAIKYEDVTKVELFLKFELFVYFIMQAVFLDIYVDNISIVGSVFLLAGNLVVLGNKVYQDKYQRVKQDAT